MLENKDEYLYMVISELVEKYEEDIRSHKKKAANIVSDLLAACPKERNVMQGLIIEGVFERLLAIAECNDVSEQKMIISQAEFIASEKLAYDKNFCQSLISVIAIALGARIADVDNDYAKMISGLNKDEKYLLYFSGNPELIDRIDDKIILPEQLAQLREGYIDKVGTIEAFSGMYRTLKSLTEQIDDLWIRKENYIDKGILKAKLFTDILGNKIMLCVEVTAEYPEKLIYKNNIYLQDPQTKKLVEQKYFGTDSYFADFLKTFHEFGMRDFDKLIEELIGNTKAVFMSELSGVELKLMELENNTKRLKEALKGTLLENRDYFLNYINMNEQNYPKLEEVVKFLTQMKELEWYEYSIDKNDNCLMGTYLTKLGVVGISVTIVMTYATEKQARISGYIRAQGVDFKMYQPYEGQKYKIFYDNIRLRCPNFSLNKEVKSFLRKINDSNNEKIERDKKNNIEIIKRLQVTTKDLAGEDYGAENFSIFSFSQYVPEKQQDELVPMWRELERLTKEEKIYWIKVSSVDAGKYETVYRTMYNQLFYDLIISVDESKYWDVKEYAVIKLYEGYGIHTSKDVGLVKNAKLILGKNCKALNAMKEQDIQKAEHEKSSIEFLSGIDYDSVLLKQIREHKSQYLGRVGVFEAIELSGINKSLYEPYFDNPELYKKIIKQYKNNNDPKEIKVLLKFPKMKNSEARVRYMIETGVTLTPNLIAQGTIEGAIKWKDESVVGYGGSTNTTKVAYVGDTEVFRSRAARLPQEIKDAMLKARLS